MGSGKTTVAKLLANRLGYSFRDLDVEIEVSENMAITTIFENKGEIYFRRKESETLKDLLNVEMPMILALGGGTPCYGSNMDVILKNDNVISVYLKLSINKLVGRLQTEKEKRPLISHFQTEDGLLDYIRKHLFERSFYYNQSEIVLNCDDLGADAIVEEIVSRLL